MAQRPTLAEFVEQELRLAEPIFAGVADDVFKQWRERAPPSRSGPFDVLRVLHGHRLDFIQTAVLSLRDQVSGRAQRKAPSVSPSGRLELSLVDDDEITADIEVARVVERSNSELEEPLRELRTYTSALVGDVNAARDTNPLRPEVWVRATLAAARQLPMPRDVQIALVRVAAQPLIRALDENYRAASARLHALGVMAALHRTVVNEGVVTELTDAMRARRALERRADEYGSEGDTVWGTWLPDGQVQTRRPNASEPARRVTHHEPPAALPNAELHQSERLALLYDAILSDRRLPRESLPLLSRLYPTVLHQTLVEPALLENRTHAVWSFIDNLAFLMLTREVGDAQANTAFAQSLVDQLAGQSAADARPFQSATNRLVVLERQRYARAVSAAAADIAVLSAAGAIASDGGLPSVPLSLDAGGGDSQPAPLLRRGADAAPAVGDAVGAWRAGSWLTIFLRGRWRRALVLWRAPSPGALLLLDANEARHWALRAPALERLATEGLARPFAPRSLVGDAGSRVVQPGRKADPTHRG